MKIKSTLFAIGMLSIATACVASKEPHALADEWELVGEVVNEPGYHVWGCSPMQTDDGKVHLFRRKVRKQVQPGFQ
jgi:hypothetical protein